MPMYTEHETEYWLESQTRDLPTRGGSARTHTAFRLVWHAYDSLVSLNGYSESELVGYAFQEMKLQNINFDQAFRCVIGWLDDQRRERWGTQ